MFRMMKLYESKRWSIICSVLLVTAVCEEVGANTFSGV